VNPTGRAALAAMLTPSDRLSVNGGELLIDGVRATDLVAQHGSPLYVAVEATLRDNYRRIERAFAQAWRAPVTVMYAAKANPALAIRAVMSAEGAGGDCFGLGELHAALATGTDPRRIVMNGSNKGRAEITMALSRGIIVNIDSVEEIAEIEACAASIGQKARVNLRLKVLPSDLDRYGGEFFRSADGALAAVRRSKWGYTTPEAARLVQRLAASPHVELLGYSCHVGRFTNAPEAFAIVCRSIGEAAAQIARETGFWPRMIDAGGGWPRQREPESRGPSLNPHPIETYAQVATAALAEGLAASNRPLPELWLEPGRYIVGNAVLMLATVGAIKRDAGRTWVHVDACTNHLMRVDTSGSWHPILPANRMEAPLTDTVDIVGSTCIPSVLGTDRAMPALQAGDVVAILDTGMYADAISNQFNGVPRPATILIGNGDVAVIRRRETIEDLYSRDAVPPRLLAPRTN
jgi:diaminopimelate decarboxylase